MIQINSQVCPWLINATSSKGEKIKTIEVREDYDKKLTWEGLDKKKNRIWKQEYRADKGEKQSRASEEPNLAEVDVCRGEY